RGRTGRLAVGVTRAHAVPHGTGDEPRSGPDGVRTDRDPHARTDRQPHGTAHSHSHPHAHPDSDGLAHPDGLAHTHHRPHPARALPLGLGLGMDLPYRLTPPRRQSVTVLRFS
ncbi:hypothetical protein ACEWKJ_35060, partial [Streptomyces chrestomyceticus]